MYVLAVNHLQRNKMLEPNCSCVAFVRLGEFDSVFRIVPSSV